MKIFSKLKRFLSLNAEFLSRSKKHNPAPDGRPVSLNPKRIWFYAESLGEFRLALYMIDIIKQIFSEKNIPSPAPIFFISFKTFSTLSLAERAAKNGSRILFFFHPFLSLKPIFKKYIYAVKPDYFISLQHPVSKKLVEELLNFGVDSNLNIKLIFAGISAADLKKMDMPEKSKTSGNFSLSAVISDCSGCPGGAGSAGGSNSAEVFGCSSGAFVKLKIMPLSLKYMSCNGEAGGHAAEDGANYKNIVISFVSVHKRESLFILKLLKEIISGEKPAKNFNLKFILVPRNVKIAGVLFKKASKIGLYPAYYGGNGENMKVFLKSERVGTLIVDQYGILSKLYPVSDIVYVGKSLFKSESGGHNILEPAGFGKATLTGLYAVNFQDIINEMIRSNAITLVDEKNFKEVLIKLLGNEKLRNETGQNGLNFCIKKRDEFKTYFKNYLSEIL